LQAAAKVLAAPPRAGACTDDCPCSTAASASASATTYYFPPKPDATPAEQTEVACALDQVEVDGDAPGRIAEWQSILTDVTRREAIDQGLALVLPFDPELAGRVARVAAAEYRCCSFGSWTVVIDGRGVRLEIRMPSEAHTTLFGVFGIPG
jgi:hypothetical protein